MASVNVQLTKGERFLAFNFVCSLANQTIGDLRRVKDVKVCLGVRNLDSGTEDMKDITRTQISLTEGDTKWLLKELNSSNIFNGQQEELALGLVDALEDGLKEYKQQEI